MGVFADHGVQREDPVLLTLDKSPPVEDLASALNTVCLGLQVLDDPLAKL